MRSTQGIVQGRTRRALGAFIAMSFFLLLVAACSSDSNGYKKIQITVISEPSAPNVVDNPPSGPSQGDSYAFMQQLVDEAGKPAGRIEGFSVTTDVGSRGGQDAEYRQSVTQFTLDNGTILVSGVYFVEPRGGAPITEGVRRPVVGGTGAYLGARGQVFQTPLSEGRFKNVIEIEIPT
ncbi:MAG TPA: hypothetical protein VM121_11035 [Acidimicrobiales bacterium]|nr:hypothetical protein [Acidimicrobiales bacterium]